MRVTVRVPASAANLGPGFDCFGLALDLSNEVVADTSERPGVTWEGEGADELPTDGGDLVSATVASIARQMGLPVPPYALHGLNRIPLERGLGSSSAAAVAGVMLASALLELGWHEDRTTVFAAAAGVEGHPDNAAPAVFGGFTLAMPDGFVHRFDPHPDVRPVVIVPPIRLLTAQARAALPATVPHADAAFNAAYAGLAVEAFARDPSLLGRALHDRLHQDARLALVPDVQERAELLRHARIPVVVSGAGPTLIAFESDATPTVTAELLDVSHTWRILRPGVRAAGAEVSFG